MNKRTSPRYIKCTDTAKLLRKALKREFPSTKFYVRSSSYAGGASIDVDWMDGPLTKNVDAIAQLYRGERFDAMIDMRFTVDAYLLPDGSVFTIEHPGTYHNAGSHPPNIAENVPPEAEKVHFLADHVSTQRAHSRALCERVLDGIEKEQLLPNYNRPDITESDWYVGNTCRGKRANFSLDWLRAYGERECNFALNNQKGD